MRTALLSLTLLLAALPALPQAAAADPLCENAAPLASNPTPWHPQVGVVAPDGSAWFHHLAYGDATYQVAALQASQRNVDLYVWDSSCTAVLCQSTNGLLRDDRCEVSGGDDYRVEVRDATGEGTAFTIYAAGARSPDPTLSNEDGTCTLERRPDGPVVIGAPCAVPPDTDGDGAPDAAEALLCANQREETVADGTCAAGNWSAPTPAAVVAELTGRLADADSDGIPDAAEPTLCAAEDDGRVADGSCDAEGADYAAPEPGAALDEVLGLLPDNPDGDGDNVPDALEAALCQDNDPDTVADGTCDAGGWNAPAPEALVTEALGLVPDGPDADEDGVPDAAEPALCGLEDDARAADGACAGGDYTPPTVEEVLGLVPDPDADDDGLPNEAEAALCTNEDEALASDGSCDVDGWTAPAPGDVVAEATGIVTGADEDGDAVPDAGEAAVCGSEDETLASDGACDEDDWTAPAPEDVVAEVIGIVTGLP